MNFKSFILAMSCIATTAAQATPPATYATSLDQVTQSVVSIQESYQLCHNRLVGPCVQNLTLEQDSVELLLNAVSNYQDDMIAAFQNIMGISAVPARINTLILGVIQQLTSDPINSPIYPAAEALGVPQTVGTIVGSSANFITTISNVIADFFRDQWVMYADAHPHGLKPLSSTASNTVLNYFKGAGVLASDVGVANATYFDLGVLFSDNSIKPHDAFLGADTQLVNQDDLVERMGEAIHAWARAAQLSLSEDAINNFCASIINGTTMGSSGNGLYGIMHTKLDALSTTGPTAGPTAGTTNVTIALTSTDVVSSIDTATIEAINTFNKAFQFYVYPKELDDYASRLKRAVSNVNATNAGGATASEAYTSFLTQALTRASDKSYNLELNVNYTMAEIPYLATNISFNLNQEIQTLWASLYKGFMSSAMNSPVKWYGTAIATNYFGSSQGLPTKLREAVLSGVNNWMYGIGLENILTTDALYTMRNTMIDVFGTFVEGVTRPSSLSFPTMDDLTRTTTEAMGSLYTVIARIQKDVVLD